MGALTRYHLSTVATAIFWSPWDPLLIDFFV
jgi:hypothetical protein